MTDDKKQPLPVHGYTEQHDAKIAMVNNNKIIEEAMLRNLDEVEKLDDVDKRWLALARTHIETGFMCLNRSIFKPERVDIPEEYMGG